jgi:hypothetical protein
MANTTPETQVESEVIDYTRLGFSEAVMEKMLDDLYEEFGREPTPRELVIALNQRPTGYQ